MNGLYIAGAISVMMVSLGVENLCGSGWAMVSGGLVLMVWGLVWSKVVLIGEFKKG